MKITPLKTSFANSLLVLLLGLMTLNAQAGEEVDLLKGGLSSWTEQKSGAWMVNDGVLSPSDKPGGYIWSKDSYGDFEISIEYKIHSMVVEMLRPALQMVAEVF